MKWQATKRGWPALLLVTILLLGGCTLATGEGQRETGRDTLIGLYLTTEYVDSIDWESVDYDDAADGLLDNVAGVQLEGVLDMRARSLSFPGLAGWACVWIEPEPEAESQRGYRLAEYPLYGMGATFNQDRSEFRVSLAYDQTQLASQDELDAAGQDPAPDPRDDAPQPVPEGLLSIYPNSVYQRPDGSVYLRGGSGLTMNGGGAEFEVVDKYTLTVNGQAQSHSVSFTVQLEPARPLARLQLRQLDAGDQLLQADEFTALDLPGQYQRRPDTAYVLAVQTYSDGQISRDIINSDQDLYSVFLPTGGLLLERRAIFLTPYAEED